MNGLMSRYKESLAETPGPIMERDLSDVVVDLRGISAYARERGVQPAQLSKEEQERFIFSRASTARPA